MSWLAVSLLTAFLWGGVQTLDKLAVSRLIRYVPAYVALIALVGAGTAAVLYISGTTVTIGGRWILLSLLSGVLTISYTYLFLSSLHNLDAPEASTILLLVPVVSSIIGVTAFGERIGAAGLVGIGVIILGAYLATREEEEFHSRNRNAVVFSVGLLIAASIIISLLRALEKYILFSVAKESLFFWERIGVLACTLLAAFILPGARNRAAETLSKIPGYAFIIVVVNELTALAATYTQLVALDLGPLGVTSTLISASPVFALTIVSTANTIRHDTIPDTGSKRQFLPRLGAILLTLTGIWLLSL